MRGTRWLRGAFDLFDYELRVHITEAGGRAKFFGECGKILAASSSILDGTAPWLIEIAAKWKIKASIADHKNAGKKSSASFGQCPSQSLPPYVQLNGLALGFAAEHPSKQTGPKPEFHFLGQ